MGRADSARTQVGHKKLVLAALGGVVATAIFAWTAIERDNWMYHGLTLAGIYVTVRYGLAAIRARRSSE